MKLIGLTGFPLSHSFSAAYFHEKFQKEGIDDFEYCLFPLESVSDLRLLLREYPDLIGLNVTIPHKESVLPLLDSMDPTVSETGAANTLCIERVGSNTCIRGYNTDVIGFEHLLRSVLLTRNDKALILGNGGASKAVQYVLKKRNIAFQLVSRNRVGSLSYDDVDQNLISQHRLIINTTPLGMYPQQETCPVLPYQFLTKNHVGIDLVYNPAETLFLTHFIRQGSQAVNGLSMLHAQADASWEIWKNA